MKAKKAIVFDFDGTLVDSMERLTQIAEEVLSSFFGLPKKEGRRLYIQTSGLAFPDQLKTLFPSAGTKNKKAAKAFEEKKREGYFEERLYPDTHATIDYLRKKGYRIIISSNSEQDLVDQLVTKLKIPCDLKLGFRENFSKGLPHFLYIFQHWGVKRKDLVFVGDSLKDAERARENKIDFIGKEGLFQRNDFLKQNPTTRVISTLAELKEIF